MSLRGLLILDNLRVCHGKRLKIWVSAVLRWNEFSLRGWLAAQLFFDMRYRKTEETES